MQIYFVVCQIVHTNRCDRRAWLHYFYYIIFIQWICNCKLQNVSVDLITIEPIKHSKIAKVKKKCKWKRKRNKKQFKGYLSDICSLGVSKTVATALILAHIPVKSEKTQIIAKKKKQWLRWWRRRRRWYHERVDINRIKRSCDDDDDFTFGTYVRLFCVQRKLRIEIRSTYTLAFAVSLIRVRLFTWQKIYIANNGKNRSQASELRKKNTKSERLRASI